MSQEFGAVSDVRFEWKRGAGAELCRTPGVGNIIKQFTNNAHSRAEAMTPRSGTSYQNYGNETKIAGRNHMWRGRVWCISWNAMHENLKSNILLKAIR